MSKKVNKNKKTKAKPILITMTNPRDIYMHARYVGYKR
jgi:hypothetical protein